MKKHLIIKNNKIYLVYDNNIAFRYSLHGLEIVKTSDIKNGKYITFYMGRKKTVKLKLALINLLSKKEKLSILDKIDFNKFIYWLLLSHIKIKGLKPDAKNNQEIIKYILDANKQNGDK